MLRPEQCRAARALLGWSQDRLAASSGVPKRTIADFERGATMPQERTLRAISEALTVNGICLIPENGGGVGVRVGTAAPRLLFRRDAVDGHAWVAFAFDYRGARRVGFITYQALDAIDLDRGRLPLEEFDQHQEAILLLAAQLFDRNVIDARGRVLIERGNVNRPPFPENDDGAE